MAQSAFSKALASEVIVVGGQHQVLKVDTALDALDAASRRDALKALLDPTQQHSVVARTFCALGQELTDNAVAKWRKTPERRVARKANGDRK